jgi:hypothetical protein
MSLLAATAISVPFGVALARSSSVEEFVPPHAMRSPEMSQQVRFMAATLDEAWKRVKLRFADS